MFCSKRCVVAPLRETFFLHPHRAAVESGKDFFSRNGATTQRKSGSERITFQIESLVALAILIASKMVALTTTQRLNGWML